MPDREQHQNQRRRFSDNDERRESVESRLAALEQKVERISVIEAKLDDNTTKLDANTVMTKRSNELFEGMEAGIKALGAIGAFAKWLAPIIGLCVTVWALIHGNEPPKTH